jgi:hypothetical protein
MNTIKTFNNYCDIVREDEDEDEDKDGIDHSLNLWRNNENFLSFNNREIEDTANPLAWNNNGDCLSLNMRFESFQDIGNMNNDSMMTDRYISEYQEIMEEKEQKANDKVFDEINNIENKVTSNKTTNKDLKLEKLNPYNGPENAFISKKRKKSFSIDTSNDKNNENPPNQKEIINPQFKIEKAKQKAQEKNNPKNISSLVPDIKSFHTLLNIYFKHLVEEGNSFNVNVFNKKGGSNGYYINKDFTQSKLGAKVHSLKLEEKITKFINEKKLEKIKKKKVSLDILNLTARELIYMFYGYIFENLNYFKTNETIKEINNNFLRIRKYPLIGFEDNKIDEKYKFGYFKYYD